MTTETMIERMARALAANFFDEDDGSESGPMSNRQVYIDEAWTGFMGDARAALQALREPTETMTEIGASHWWVEIDGPTSDRKLQVASGSFTAMIDAALQEKTP